MTVQSFATVLILTASGAAAQSLPGGITGDVTLSYSKTECMAGADLSCNLTTEVGSLVGRIEGRADVALGPNFGLQADLAFSDSMLDSNVSFGFKRQALGLHGYWRAQSGTKLGVFAGQSTIDGYSNGTIFSSLDYTTIGAEALFDIGQSMTVEVAVGQTDIASSETQFLSVRGEYEFSENWTTFAEFQNDETSSGFSSSSLAFGAEMLVDGLGRPVYLGIVYSYYTNEFSQCVNTSSIDVSLRIPFGDTSTLFSRRIGNHERSRADIITRCFF